MRSSSPKTDRPPHPLPERVLVGQVIRPHGLLGEVVVEVLSDVPGRFAPGARLDWSGGGRGAERRELEIESVRPAKVGLLVRFAGVADRTGAEALAPGALEIDRARVPKAEAGTFYWFELIGCSCRDAGRGELGEIVDLLDSGGALLLVIEGGGRRLLVPFVQEFLVATDLEARRLELALPEGLIEACASTS